MYSIRRIDENRVQIRGDILDISDIPSSEYAFLENCISSSADEIRFVFKVYSDPLDPDSDDDYYIDSNYYELDPLSSDLETIGLGRASYIISDRDDGYIHIYGIPVGRDPAYGGHQSCFENDNLLWSFASIVDSGCGLIATNDVLLYLNNGPSSYSWDEYHEFVLDTNNDFLEMQSYVGPNIPLPNTYALSCSAVQECLAYNGHISTNYIISESIQDDVLDMIINSLNADRPIILMEDDYFSSKEECYNLYQVTSEPVDSISDLFILSENKPTMYYHYVTITGVAIDHHCVSQTDYDHGYSEVYLRVQSWGDEYYIKYSDFIEYNRFYFGRLIFVY